MQRFSSLKQYLLYEEHILVHAQIYTFRVRTVVNAVVFHRSDNIFLVQSEKRNYCLALEWIVTVWHIPTTVTSREMVTSIQFFTSVHCNILHHSSSRRSNVLCPLYITLEINFLHLAQLILPHCCFFWRGGGCQGKVRWPLQPRWSNTLQECDHMLWTFNSVNFKSPDPARCCWTDLLAEM